MSWTLTIDSTDRTSYAVSSSLRVSNTGYPGLGTLSVDLWDPDNDLAALANEQTVSLVQDGTTIFGGRIRVIDKTHSGTRGLRLLRLTCQDFTQDPYDDVVDDGNRQTTENDSTRISWLFSTFDTHGVTVGTAVKTVASVEDTDYTGLLVGEALDSICTVTGASWYVDQNQALHYFATETYASPFNLTDSSPNYSTTYPYRDFTLPYDTTEYASDIYVVGNNIATWVSQGTPTYTPRRYKVLRDSSIESLTTATAVGTAFLQQHGTAVRHGSLVCDEPGLRAGMTVQITNTAHGLSAESFRVQQVDTGIDPRTNEPYHSVRFGEAPPTLPTFVGRATIKASRAERSAVDAVALADLSIAGANLVTNSSFENASTTGWTVGSNWVFGYGAGTGTAFWGTATARGTLSAQTLGNLDTPFIAVDETGDFVVSSWRYVRSHSSGTFNFQVVQYDSGQTALGTATIESATAADTGWTRASLLLGPNTSLGRTQWETGAAYVKLRWNTTGSSTMTVDVDGVQVERGGRATAYAPAPQELNDNAITTTQIAGSAITTPKIAALNITAGLIAGSAITADKIDAGAVTTEKLLAGEITLYDETGEVMLEPAGFGPTWRRFIRQGVYNGDFVAIPGTPANNISNATNPLPHWSFVQASGTAITAKVAADSDQASGYTVRFTMTSGASGDQSYLQQVVPVSANRDQTYTFRPYFGWRYATSGTAYGRLYVESTWLNSGGTAIGTAYKTATTYLQTLTPGTATAEWGHSGDGFYGVPPTNAASLRVRVGMERGTATTGSTGSVDVTNIYTLTGQPRYHFPDTIAPETYNPASFFQASGTLQLTNSGLITLSAGTAVVVSSSNLLRLGGGTFPSNPSDGDLYYFFPGGGEFGEWFEYDSVVGWVGPVRKVAFGPGETLPEALTSARGTTILDGVYRLPNPAFGSHSIYVVEVAVTTYVATTNNGSNYWSGGLANWTGSTRSYMVNAYNTSADSADEWTQHISSVALSVASTVDMFHIEVGSKTSSPGALSLGGAVLTYRDIRT